MPIQTDRSLTGRCLRHLGAVALAGGVAGVAALPLAGLPYGWTVAAAVPVVLALLAAAGTARHGGRFRTWWDTASEAERGAWRRDVDRDLRAFDAWRERRRQRLGE